MTELVLALGSLVFVVARTWGSGKGRRAWAAAGHALGIDDVYARGDAWHLDGTVDGYSVKARAVGVKAPRIQLIVRGGLPTDLELRPEGALDRLLSPEDIQLDDPAFDQALRVTGDATSALIFLDSATRKRWVKAARTGVRLETGELVLLMDRPASASLILEKTVRAMVRLARGMDHREMAAPLRLARALRADPVASIRRRCLEALCTLEVAPDFRDRLLRRAMEDADASVRLAAAIRLGPEGHDVALAVAADPSAPDPVRVDAITYLGAHATDRLTPLLPTLVSRAALRPSVARWAARLGLLDVLMAVADPTLPAAAALDVVEGLEAGAAPAAPLVRLLDHADRDVRLAAIAALGRAGDRAALPVLRGLTSGLTTANEIKVAARAALARLTDQVGGVHGGLALADEGAGAEGGLALAGEAGGLAVSADEG